VRREIGSERIGGRTVRKEKPGLDAAPAALASRWRGWHLHSSGTGYDMWVPKEGTHEKAIAKPGRQTHRFHLHFSTSCFSRQLAKAA